MPEMWETPYQLTLHVDAKSGKQFLNYRISDRKIRAHLALMIGDAIHNLKCALDIAWGNTYTTLYPTTFEPRFLNFPFQPERKTLETVLTKKGKIPDTCRLFSFVVDSVKSYKTGNPDLWAVHRLDIHDKHRLLIVVLNFMFIDDVELEHENGEVECQPSRDIRGRSRGLSALCEKLNEGHSDFTEVHFSSLSPLSMVSLIYYYH